MSQKTSRMLQSEERKKAMIHSALEAFTKKGFAAARMEDIAKDAGVAKGTLFLYFKDKEALFEEVLKFHILPILSALDLSPSQSPSLRHLIEDFLFQIIQNPKAFQIFSLLISESNRFPHLPEIYFRLIIQRGSKRIEELLRSDAFVDKPSPEVSELLIQFPQLVLAPSLLGMLWHHLFREVHPLDLQKMVRTYLDFFFPIPHHLTDRRSSHD